ncbi:hypothetical protein ACN28S_35725 [Cystobacter fuscus]
MAAWLRPFSALEASWFRFASVLGFPVEAAWAVAGGFPVEAVAGGFSVEAVAGGFPVEAA